MNIETVSKATLGKLLRDGLLFVLVVVVVLGQVVLFVLQAQPIYLLPLPVIHLFSPSLVSACLAETLSLSVSLSLPLSL